MPFINNEVLDINEQINRSFLLIFTSKDGLIRTKASKIVSVESQRIAGMMTELVLQMQATLLWEIWCSKH
jgi:hypothetical protein